jgi:hypothetical protein
VNGNDNFYILPDDMEFIIGKFNKEITYNILSHLAEKDILELCYSDYSKDFLWRIKK